MVGQSKVGVALALCFNSQPELKPANQALHSAQMCKMPWEEGEEEPVSAVSSSRQCDFKSASGKHAPSPCHSSL